MDFKEYIQDRLNEADDQELALNNAGEVLTDLYDVINNLATIFSAMSTEGNLNGNKVVPVQCVEIRKKINAINESSKNRDEVFTQKECKDLKTISDNLNTIIKRKIKDLSVEVTDRIKKEKQKLEKQTAVEPEPDTVDQNTEA